MKIHRARIPLLFFSALLFAGGSAAAYAQGDKAGENQPPAREQPQIVSETAGEAGGAGADENGVVTPAVKRNFSARFGVELTDKDKRAVAMHPDDARRFAAFLERKDAGFARLYDVAECEMDRRILKVNDQCPANMLGRGTTYSFRRKKYQTNWFSDLKIQQGTLQSTGLNVLGFLTDLGEAPLESLSLDDAPIRAMAAFRPAENFEAVREQAYVSARGFRLDNILYRSAVPLKENSTYALRSIAYRGTVRRRAGRFWVNALDGDKREDVIVVFRLIRRHANGSVSLLWRELQRTRSPKLIIPKDKK